MSLFRITQVRGETLLAEPTTRGAIPVVAMRSAELSVYKEDEKGSKTVLGRASVILAAPFHLVLMPVDWKTSLAAVGDFAST